ncbi:MAG: site-specific integrase [Chloroflexi bacterium]|nr:site-specific integrase [Chloroflexota bacterium]
MFLDAVQGDRLEALYTVALSVDLRQGEALSLRWEDVNLEQRRLSVRYALQRIGGKLQLVEPKTAKSRRTLALPAFAVTALRAHKVRQLEERVRLGAHWRDTGFIFTSSVGTPLEARNVVRQSRAHLQRAGLPRRRFHDLRHSAATLLLAQGEELRNIMELLGHSQSSITGNLYAHVLDAQVLDAAKQQLADKMDALLSVSRSG